MRITAQLGLKAPAGCRPLWCASEEPLSRHPNAWDGWPVKNWIRLPEHKKIKNEFASRFLWQSIKDVKTVGVIQPRWNAVYRSPGNGVIAGLVPAPIPPLRFLPKCDSVKARDGIVIAPTSFSGQILRSCPYLDGRGSSSGGAPQGYRV